MKQYSWDDPQTCDLIILLQDIDLLPQYLTIDEIIKQANNSHYQHASVITLLNLLTLDIFSFDTECIYTPVNDYHELIAYFMLWSKGMFEPEYWQIYYTGDEPDNWDVQFSFTLEGENYEVALPYQGDWANLAFISVINQTLREATIDGQFYRIVSKSQVAVSLFLKQSQITPLLDQNLIEVNQL